MFIAGAWGAAQRDQLGDASRVRRLVGLGGAQETGTRTTVTPIGNILGVRDERAGPVVRSEVVVETDDAPAVRMRVAPRGLRDQVYELILDMLTETETVPGSRLSIDRLAAELGVSPTPVREALIEVEKTGLITREIHKGYRVASPLSDGQLEALFDTRLVLEGGAVELAARQLDTLLPPLRAALDAQRALGSEIQASFTAGESLSAHALRDYFRADWQFHRVIFEGTHNPFLLDMSEAISTRVHRMRQVARTGVPDAPFAIVEHQAILDGFEAILDGNEKGAQQAVLAMRDHIERVRIRARQDSTTTTTG